MSKRKSFSTRKKDNAPSAMENGQSSPKLKKRHKGLIAFVGLGAVLTILVGVLFASWSFLQYTFVSQGPLAEETVFTVPQGAGTSSIANKLAAEGIIDSATMFKLMIRLDKVDGTLKAGEFMIPPEASLRDVMEVLKDGKAILYPFTAPEGLTSAQIMRAMAKVPTLIDDSPGMPAEGTLLPETYMTPRGMSRSQLVAKMQTAQSDLLDKLWDKRQDGLPIKTREEAIILASIVEKETGVTSERDKVAGVFINRLNKGMRLQSDPTIIYGVSQGEPLGRGIRQSEIDRVTDWNTYQMDGLPKTPICNPGREAIAAVLNPAATEYIYFVADGTGGHIFGKTLAEHNENVKNWRKIERERKRAAGGGE